MIRLRQLAIIDREDFLQLRLLTQAPITVERIISINPQAIRVIPKGSFWAGQTVRVPIYLITGVRIIDPRFDNWHTRWESIQ